MLARLIAAQNRRNWHPYPFLLFCAFVGLGRGLLEIVLQGITLYNSDIFNFLPFYILLGLLLTLALSATAGNNFQSVQKSLIMGLFIGLFPPLIDYVVFQNASAFYGYYYLWDFSQLPYAGYKPEFNFPAGETCAIWISILFCGLYTHTVSRTVWRGLIAVAGAYLIFIFMGSLLPMFVAKISQVKLPDIAAARATDTMTLRALAMRIAFYQAILAFFVYLLIRRDLFAHVLRRSLHIAPFVMLTILGGIIVAANPVSLAQSALLIAVYGIVAIVQNDFFDARLTSEKNQPTVAQKHDVQIINVLYWVCLIPLFMHNNRAAIAGAVIFVCGMLYNYPFYRARDHFPANLKIEGVWGLCAFLAGALVDAQAAARPYVVFVGALVFGGWSTVAVLKDLKDTDADFTDRVSTIFTIFMRRGYSAARVWRVVRLVLMCFLSLPLLFAVTRLPLPPLLALVAVTFVFCASLWLRPGKKTFQVQLVILTGYVFFWQLAFGQKWLLLS